MNAVSHNLAVVYQASPIKCHRRTKAEIEEIKEGLWQIVQADAPMTVRQVFYQAVGRGLVEKTEAEYTQTVGRLLLAMRRDRTLPYRWLSDATRWMRKPETYTGLAGFIDRHQRVYRRDLWAESNAYVEIWLEKDALAGVLHDVTEEYDVPLMVSRGFASESYIYGAAEVIDARCYGGGAKIIRDATIYYFGDHDPSGIKIDPAIERSIRRILVEEFNWPKDPEDQPLSFERAAVTERQIRIFELPTRPTKIKGNRHAKGWSDDHGSVELDAVPASDLRTLVRAFIERHVDQGQLAHLRAVETEERDQLRLFAKQLEARS